MPVEIIFHRGGDVTITPKGYPGRLCHEVTRIYEDTFKGLKTVQQVNDAGAQQAIATPQQQHIGGK